LLGLSVGLNLLTHLPDELLLLLKLLVEQCFLLCFHDLLFPPIGFGFLFSPLGFGILLCLS
jgi:hypothetical protein